MPTLTHIEDTAAVKAARAELLPVAQKLETLTNTLRRYERILDSSSHLHEEERITEDARLEAQAEVFAVRQNWARTMREFVRLTAVIEHERRTEAERLEAAARAQLSKAVKAMIAAVEPARAANREVLRV